MQDSIQKKKTAKQHKNSERAARNRTGWVLQQQRVYISQLPHKSINKPDQRWFRLCLCRLCPVSVPVFVYYIYVKKSQQKIARFFLNWAPSFLVYLCITIYVVPYIACVCVCSIWVFFVVAAAISFHRMICAIHKTRGTIIINCMESPL